MHISHFSNKQTEKDEKKKNTNNNCKTQQNTFNFKYVMNFDKKQLHRRELK